MISDDEYLERVVAGIHSISGNEADVKWNERIGGRQFDVVVRFKNGPLSFITVIEVKNRTRKAGAEDLDAFVNKARDQSANKAVFVTAAGFQSGAIKIAEKHGVDLFTVRFGEDEAMLAEGLTSARIRLREPKPGEKEIVRLGQPSIANMVVSIKLTYLGGKVLPLPDEASQLTYYAVKSQIVGYGSLDLLVRNNITTALGIGERRQIKIDFDTPREIRPPDDYFFPHGRLKRVECEIEAHNALPVEGNVLIEPTAFSAPVYYTDIKTGAEYRFTVDQIPLGVDKTRAGRFYFIYNPLIYYYCVSVRDGTSTMRIIESFQNGNLVTAEFTQDHIYSKNYIEVRDKAILKRLKKRLRDYDIRAQKLQQR